MRHTRFLQLLLWVLVVLPACFALSYLSATRDDPYSVMGGTLSSGDVAEYAAIYRGADLESRIKPYRYRFVVPVLARYVPLPPQVLLDYFDLSEDKAMGYRFALINAIGLFVATLGLAFLMAKMHFLIAEQLLGSFLFLTSLVTVVYGTVALVDGASFGVLALGVAAAVWKKWPALGLILLVGMFVKETSVLIAVSAILVQETRRDRCIATLACVPGLAAYAVVRFLILPTSTGFNYSPSAALYTLTHQFTSVSNLVFIGYNLLFAFGAMLVLAPIGWVITRRVGNRPQLMNLSWMAGAAIVLPFLIQTSFDRVWFLAFPVVIPLTVVTVSSIVTRVSSHLDEAL